MVAVRDVTQEEVPYCFVQMVSLTLRMILNFGRDHILQNLDRDDGSFYVHFEFVEREAFCMNSVSKEAERILSMSPEECCGSLPTDARCRLLLQIYERAVLGPRWDTDEASITKRELLDTCPKWCSKVVEKVDNTSPKVSSQGNYNFS